MMSEPLTSAGEGLVLGADPTMDEVMRRDPKTLTREDLRALVDTLRADRANFAIRERAAKDKKAGITPTMPADEEW